MTVQQHDPPTTPPAVEPGLLSRALEVAGRLANEAAEVITATAGRAAHAGVAPPGAEAKANPYDWVTDTDRTLERHTRRVLAAEFPDVPVVGEEYGGESAAADAPMRWVVDPVDGTANYVAGLPWYAYSLALVDAYGPVVGVVADPGRQRIYAAARGRGVRADGVPVRLVAGCSPGDGPAGCPAGGLICVELPAERAATFAVRATAGHVGVRALGSSTLAITQVALGHAVAAVLQGYREWDVAAALCLAVEAGAVVVDGEGRPDPLPQHAMLVAVPEALPTVLEWWRAP